ncbi:MAG TPA: M20/M25/M40 family metallo-hydrolase [Jiangellaceae bacterium]|jgi:acetylornithine deacetylase/succinyl-diaminopimelate desuccinylase-like protein|nr:M20/M25/M40 family metallo-hydrolase [Jiangellaceae bacterium]
MVDPAALDDVVRLTSELIRIDTTNRGGGDGRERLAAEFVAERLEEAGVEATILESAPGRANVVARIVGSEPGLDALLVHGHLDVVPAEAADWTVHPFSGEVRDGVVWGRGAVDMKDMDAMVLAVIRCWAREGRRPRRDIVFAFTADEEDSGAYGAGWLVGKHPDVFAGCTEGISESGAYTVHAGNGVRIYPIGAGERGIAWLRLTAHGQAGHASKVNRSNAVGALAAAVARIDAFEWPVRMTPTVRAAMVATGRALGVPVGPDDAGPDVEAAVARFGPARVIVENSLRNSARPTMLQAGYKINVVPATAVAHVDGRVVPGADDEFQRTLEELIGPSVEWEFTHREGPLQAPADSPTFAEMSAAILAEDPGSHVVPFCLGGGTDAKRFSRLGITGYGFSPLRLPPGFDYNALFHGVDERVPVDALHFGVRVLDRFLSPPATDGDDMM